jgi:hypothetical protein
MLFILTMDPLQRILHSVTEQGFLHPILAHAKGIKVSLYADDATIFVALEKRDIKAMLDILDIFGKATGLCTNLQKSEAFPIRCHGLQLDHILEGFPAPLKEFPCYLGLPLHLKELRKIDFLPLIEKVGGKLPRWKGKLMSKAARA